jgi:hypothetical protein
MIKQRPHQIRHKGVRWSDAGWQVIDTRTGKYVKHFGVQGWDAACELATRLATIVAANPGISHTDLRIAVGLNPEPRRKSLDPVTGQKLPAGLSCTHGVYRVTMRNAIVANTEDRDQAYEWHKATRAHQPAVTLTTRTEIRAYYRRLLGL